MEEKQPSPQDIYQKFVQTVVLFVDSLDTYSDEKFNFKHDENNGTPPAWSLGQMYEHIIQSANYYFLANVVRCLEKRKGQVGGSKNQAGDNVYFYGGFPPRKFQPPAAIASPEIVAKSREEYKALLAKIQQDAQNLIDPVTHDEGKYKTHHAAFEWLNAYEWFYMLEMHTRHHLRQKKELEGFANQA